MTEPTTMEGFRKIPEENFRHTPDMGEISGFGGNYEKMCQDMLAAGVKWLHRRAQKTAFPNIYNEKYLSKVIVDASKGECTGAMHDNIMQKLVFIARFGWAKYCDEMRDIAAGQNGDVTVTPQDFAVPVAVPPTEYPTANQQEFDETGDNIPRVRSFGDRAVGNFNPSGDLVVDDIKRKYAQLIDILNFRRNDVDDPEIKRLCAVAITEAQTAQMWAVKAITFG